MIPDIGVWDVQRIESLIKEGLATMGRQALTADIQNMLKELNLVKRLLDSSTNSGFAALEKTLRELEWRLQKSCLSSS